MMWGYGYSEPMILSMLFWNLIWLALLGLLIWTIMRWLSRRSVNTPRPGSQPSAMETLRQRYARGDIDAVTFEQMRERLEGTMEHPVGR